MTTFPRTTPPGGPGLAPGEAPAVRLSAAAAYELLGEVGRGGTAVVYRAVQVGLGRLVALKVVRDGTATAAQASACLRAEARALARLHHPNIVRVHAYGEHEGLPCLALEFLAGGSLGRHLGGQPVPAAWAAALVRTLAAAVAHAHRRGILHLDLKPANVAFTARGIPTLLAYGPARLPDDPPGAEAEGGVRGTPGYMAPEQREGVPRRVSTPADVYGLGAVLYELLTGRPPFLAPAWAETVPAVCAAEVVSPGRLRPGVPADLEAICLRCLRREPGRRYPSALALRGALGRFLRGQAGAPGRLSA
jgi:serine/threonine protein kinase